MMRASRTILLATLCLGSFLITRSGAGELPTWEQVLTAADRYQGPVWCGTMDGSLEIGKTIYSIFGYQLVSPERQEIVIHLYQPHQANEAFPPAGRFLRLMILRREGFLQVGNETPRRFFPSKSILQGLRLGVAFALPDTLIESSSTNENGPVITMDGTDNLKIALSHAAEILPGLEGKAQLLVDKRTGAPRQLVAFGLDEWLGVPRDGYKLLLKFQHFPGCRRSQ